MFIDLHMHEKNFSKDSFLSLEEIVTLAKKRGLDAVCITDHDSMGLKDAAAEYSAKTGFPVFTGIEYYSLQGDILAFGIDSYPRDRRGLEQNLDILRDVDAIEILNGSTLPDATMMAVQYAKKYGFAITGGSDCHYPDKVGIYATWFPDGIKTTKDLVRAVRNRECRPAFHQDFSYFLWDIDHLLL